MPPRRRHVRMEELFADTFDMEIIRHMESRVVAYEITAKFLYMIQSIRIADYVAYHGEYHFLCNYVAANAESMKETLDRMLRPVPFLSRERFLRDVKNQFMRVYTQYYIHEAYMQICTVAMGMCRRIEISRQDRSYMKYTVMLLIRVFCGDRFERETSFDMLNEIAFDAEDMDAVTVYVHMLSYMVSVTPRSFYEDQTEFWLELDRADLPHP